MFKYIQTKNAPKYFGTVYTYDFVFYLAQSVSPFIF